MSTEASTTTLPKQSGTSPSANRLMRRRIILTGCEFELEGGRITQQGTHQQLLREPGLYRRIAEIQDAVSEGDER